MRKVTPASMTKEDNMKRYRIECINKKEGYNETMYLMADSYTEAVKVFRQVYPVKDYEIIEICKVLNLYSWVNKEESR